MKHVRDILVGVTSATLAGLIVAWLSPEQAINIIRQVSGVEELPVETSVPPELPGAYIHIGEEENVDLTSMIAGDTTRLSCDVITPDYQIMSISELRECVFRFALLNDVLPPKQDGSIPPIDYAELYIVRLTVTDDQGNVAESQIKFDVRNALAGASTFSDPPLLKSGSAARVSVRVRGEPVPEGMSCEIGDAEDLSSHHKTDRCQFEVVPTQDAPRFSILIKDRYGRVVENVRVR